jgi:hypothetical protein
VGSTGATGPSGTGATGATGPAGTGSTGATGPAGTGSTGATGPSTAINATNTTSISTLYPVMVSAAGSNQTPYVDTSLFVVDANNNKLTMNGNLYVISTSQGQTNLTLSGTTLTINIAAATVFSVNRTNTISTVTITNTESVNRTASMVLMMTADGTTRAVTWPGSFRWPGGTAPTLTSTLNKVDVITAYTWDGGTNWFAFASGLNM